MGSKESGTHTKRLLVILGVVLLVHGLVLFGLIQIQSASKQALPTKTIAVHLVNITPDQPKPLPPKPIEKPKVVPVVKEQPQPKPLPVLAAPKAAVTPVAVPQVEKPIEAPSVPVATIPTQATSVPQKAEPAPPKDVQGVAYLVPPDVVYPESAREAGVTGTTIVRALININGTVDDAKVQKTSGSTILDRAAIQAVKKARFKPYRENGAAQAVYTLIPIAFTLDD
ncbi:MAG: energy transducer TonB [Gammaproteobacteria bacterium]|nr:energy transducer TonB [Gammaproteobacteria bacterium]